LPEDRLFGRKLFIDAQAFNSVPSTEKCSAPAVVVVEARIIPALARSIEASPTGDLCFIAGERGRPMTKESFGNWFREVCETAKVPGSALGLRKAGATRAAENGANTTELKALFGWTDDAMPSHYTKTATGHWSRPAHHRRWNESGTIYPLTLPPHLDLSSMKSEG
jgi:hypothetical protein